jgi:hypothetical protein
MEHLISMTDFVLEQANKTTYTEDFYQPVVNYAEFLKKPLKLGYFIPCDENDVPLEEYKRTESETIADNLKHCRIISKEERKYQKAKQRVLFEDQSDFKLWDIEDVKYSNIEDLLTDDRNYILTETAKKEIGLL